MLRDDDGGDSDLAWVDAPNSWHQSLARIVDHRFSTLAELRRFAIRAKKAGVSALMLVQINKVSQCPGPWYNGLQLCDHINGSYPAADGTLAEWRQMLKEIAPVRLMWWTNPAYWSVQGPVWAQAMADRHSDVSSWFSWGAEDCQGVTECMGRNVQVPGVGCAQGSWGSLNGFEGERSALASFGSPAYADYMVDAMANSWTRNLGIDGYTEDVSANYGCMMQTNGRGSMPSWRQIVARVRRQQPQVVMSGEGYSSWSNIIESDANLGGQGDPRFILAMRRAVLDGDASTLEPIASTSGADAATVVCYLHPAYDGQQPGGCPTLYFRDRTAVIREVGQHTLWVALMAGSGIVAQHDYDPESTCMGWEGCAYWMQMDGPGAWWNVTGDPYVEGRDSPLWAFSRHRSLNRLALRSKLPISQVAPPNGKPDGGALAYLKHDALGPHGDACILVFNPHSTALEITIDLSALPPVLLDGSVTPRDLMRMDAEGGAPGTSVAPPPLAATWTVRVEAGQAHAFGGFTLASFAPRRGKRGACVAEDGFQKPAAGSTLQECFLECPADSRCANVHVGYVHITYMERPPPTACTLLGSVPSPSAACVEGTGTLIRKLEGGRPLAPPSPPSAAPAPVPPPPAPPPRIPQPWPGASFDELTAYRASVLYEGAHYDAARVPPLSSLPTLTASNRATFPEWNRYVQHVYGEHPPLPLDLNTLSWFYWFAPVRLTAIFLCDWIDSYAEVQYGTPWTGGLAAWTWGPEHLVRRSGFFVHRAPWSTEALQASERLEVMRYGPIPQRGFVERGDMWFYHAVGSGIFVPKDAFDLPVAVHYERHMAVPRTEILGRPPRDAWQHSGYGLEQEADEFWPNIRFYLHDGTACESISSEKHILSCANLPVPMWHAMNDPLPPACVGGVSVDGEFTDGGMYGSTGIPYELHSDDVRRCGTPRPPQPRPPPRPPHLPPLQPPSPSPSEPQSPKTPPSPSQPTPLSDGDASRQAAGGGGGGGGSTRSEFNLLSLIVTLLVLGGVVAVVIERRRRRVWQARALAAAKATDMEIDTVSLVPAMQEDSDSDASEIME